MGVNTVGQLIRWVKEAEAGRGEIHGKTLTVPDSILWVDKQICGSRQVTNEAFCSALSISKGSVMVITEKLDCLHLHAVGQLVDRFVDSFRAGPGPAQKLSTNLYDIYRC